MAGDEVGGYDHTLKKFAWGVVKGTKKSIKRGLVAMYAAGTLIARPILEHHVWTENHRDYVAAQNLKVGDTFLDGKGATLRLDSLVVKPDTTLTVYNFEVENLHNYYVGTQEVLVHNECLKLKLLRDNLATIGVSETNIIKFVESLQKTSVKAKLSEIDRAFLHSHINSLSDTQLKEFVTLVNGATDDYKAILLKLGTPPNLVTGSYGFNAWKIVKLLNLTETERYVKVLTRDLTKHTDLIVDIISNTNSRNDWKSIVDDPSTAIQKVKEKAENLDLTNETTWKSFGNSVFWQDFINGPGKKFEKYVVSDMIRNGELPEFKAFTDLGYNHSTQVYLLRIKSDGTKALSLSLPMIY